MKFFLKLGLFFGLAVSVNLSLKGEVVNDGTSTNKLIKIFNGNENDDGAVTSLLVDTNGFLIAQQTPPTTLPARRNVWYPLGGFATSSVYTVSADFEPAEFFNECRGGVMGWLNLSTRKGISFHIQPGDPAPSFRVSVVDFSSNDPSGVENVTNLFNLNGSPATEDYGSTWSGLGASYVATNFATFQLAFAAPSAADLVAVSNATAHITARVFQGTNTSGAPIQTGQTIELLTDLPLPGSNDHRFGYFALWGTLFRDGSTIGYLDNLSAEGQVTVLTNLPPSVTITNPTSGATFTEPSSVTIQTDATDLDGTISRVDFYAGTSLIGTATNSPFNFTWNNVAAGSYALRAQAMDNQGATATSGPVNITVTMSGGTGPTITVVQTGNTIEISWPSPGYQLQMSTNLAAGSWTDVPNTLTTNRVVLTITSGNAFFRLFQGSAPPTPTLSIQVVSGTVTVSWPAQVTGYRLQSKSDLNTPTWTDLSAPNNQFSEPATGPAKFYRLINP